MCHGAMFKPSSENGKSMAHLQTSSYPPGFTGCGQGEAAEGSTATVVELQRLIAQVGESSHKIRIRCALYKSGF